MAVALKSLRVTVDGDSGGYVRAAAAKVDADSKMVAGDRARAASLAQADAAMAKAIPGVGGLSKRLLDGYSAGAQFEAIVKRIANAMDRGMGLDRADTLLDAAYRKFNLTADAAALAERGFVSIVPAVDAMNARMMAAATNAERLQTQLRAQSFQQNMNASFGIGGPDTSAARAADVAAYGAELDRLRAKFNPLFAAGQSYKAELGEISRALQVGAISETEHAVAIERTKASFASQVGVIRNSATAVGLSAGAWQNLGYQINDIVTGLASGQSPFMILAQQGGQVQQVLAGAQGGVGGALRSIGGYLGSLVSVGRVAFGGIVAGAGAATLAVNSYLDAQQRVAMALTGAGRASGATTGSISGIASAGASTFGLSISEARDLAAALAATGKVANDDLLPIVKIGKDIANAFGTDAADATKMLADAFADPVRGADTLNARLGFLDAAQKRNIESLIAQNNLYGAQRALLGGVQQGLSGVSDAVSRTTKGWTALGNAISNGWTDLGGFVAASLGLGRTLDQQLDQAKAKLAELKGNGGYFTGIGFDLPVKLDGGTIAKQQAVVDQLSAALERNRNAAAAAAAAQRSFLQESTVRSLVPEIAQQESLNNQLRVLQDLMTSLGNDEAAGARLKQLGVSFEAITSAIRVASAQIHDFKSEFDRALQGGQIANAAITAFSPTAKADIARQQSLLSTANSNYTGDQRKVLSEQAYSNALKEANTALAEQARARALSANQALASAQLDIDLIGKSIGQQAELRANLQARQQLEQQASQYRTGFDDAEYERLKKINAELGRRTELAARAQIGADISFGRQTALLSPDDVQIAQQLKSIYPDVAEALGSVQAAGLRANQALSQASSTISGNLTTGIADAIDGTKTFGAAMADTGKLVIRALEEMLIKLYIIGPLMRSLQGSFNLFGGSEIGTTLQYGGLPGTAGSSLFGPLAPSALGNVFAGGNIIPFARGGVVSRPVMFPMANGGVGLMGEAGPEAVMPLRRGSDGRLGVSLHGAGGSSSSGGIASGGITFNGGIQIAVPEGTSPTDAATIARTVKDTMTQVVDERIAHHTRYRGMLNRGN